MPERIRAEDPLDADFQQLRQPIFIHKSDSYTKWIVGVVGAGIITILGFLGARDRQSVDDRQSQVVSTVAQQAAMLAGHDSELRVMKVRQEQMVKDLEAINTKLDKQDDKLDLVLSELRKRSGTK